MILSGDSAGKVIALGQTEISVGRHPDNEVVLDSQMVSRQHAKLFKSDRQYFIEDLGSRNGVLLNGKKLMPNARAPLHHRDEVQLSDRRMLFLSCEGAEEAHRLATIHLDHTRIRNEADAAIEEFLKPREDTP